jgi:hypothetical protein
MSKKDNKKVNVNKNNNNTEEKNDKDKEFEKKLKKFLRDSAQNIAQQRKNIERKQK